jgi:PAS domain S-box-containing protein
MFLIPGYSIIETLEENSFHLYRGIRNKDQLQVIIKSSYLKDDYHSKLLQQEFELTSHLENPSILKPIALEQSEEYIALVYEKFKGQSLHQFLKNNRLPLKQFLNLAITMASAFSKLHENGIIHKDIKPENLLINADTNEIKVIDFGISTRLPSSYSEEQPSQDTIQGSLFYISPEQTGRTNRTIDLRTDMYSLGVTFYVMLTHKLPFEAHDALEWVYSHIAKIATPVKEVNASIPEVVSDIISKLMEKLPEDRYQSMEGLRLDLVNCLEELEKTETISPFPLGKKDISGKLQISQQLYGRIEEIESLITSYEQMVHTGIPEFTLVSGYSGIGKTSLIKELYAPILRERGFFISGKFDQYKRDIPYSTIVDTFKELARIILTEDEANAEKWKEKILEAVGINGQVIVDVIPEIQLIIGQQAKVAELAPIETQNRFNFVFKKFIEVFSQREHPLTIFLDDLQWIDSASMRLIQEIVTNSENRFIFLIGAYRDNEVYPSHPLMFALEQIRKSQAIVNEIKLLPLKLTYLEQMIADTLKTDIGSIKVLASLIFEKTGGNPFFAIQFIKTLYRENLLTFNYALMRWTWDIEEIRSKKYSDNVADLIATKIKSLNVELQNVLMLASCIGNKFTKHSLAIICLDTEKDIEKKLKECIYEGLIYSRENNYKFLHDRIQEVAYSLISEELKPATHLRIGRLLLDGLSKEDIHHRLFDIVNQLNHGIHLITDPNEKELLIKLNLEAGRRAKSSIAYSSAKNFLNHARQLLPSDSWETSYEKTYQLYLDLFECDYLSGDIEGAEELFKEIRKNLKSQLDTANIYALQAKLLTISGKYGEALKRLLEGIELLNIHIPQSTDEIKATINEEIKSIPINLRNRNVSELLEGPTISDPAVRLSITLFSEAIKSSYNSNPSLFPLLIFRALNITLQSGNMKDTSFIYSCYATFLQTLYNDVSSATEFMELALKLNDKFENAQLKGALLQIYGGAINFYRKHVATCRPMMEEAFVASVNVGDFIFAAYNSTVSTWLIIEEGEIIENVLQVVEKYKSFSKQTRNAVNYQIIKEYGQFLLCFKGLTEGETSFNDSNFNEEESIQVFKDHKSVPHLVSHFIMKQIAAFIYEKHAESLEYVVKIKEQNLTVMNLMIHTTHYFYHALALSANYLILDEEKRSEYVQLIEEIIEKHKIWATNCPENFHNRYKLLCAELARIKGQQLDAMYLYDEAIKSAKENGFIHQEALANELAGRFYKSIHLERNAKGYLRKAYSCYKRWGADGKTKQLETNYPFLRNQQIIDISSTFGKLSVNQIDLIAIIKSLQIISNEIQFESVIDKLMNVVLEQSGAQNATLLIDRENQLLLTAKAETINNKIIVNSFNRFQNPEGIKFPESICQFVKRTKERVILDNALLPNRFSTDLYITTHHPKSIACVPVVKQNKLIGIIYLENNLYIGAFPLNKIFILDLLASQAAISMENSMLFTELSVSKQQLQDVMDNSSAVIFVKGLDGKYQFINKQYELVFEVKREYVVGKTDHQLWSTELSNTLADHEMKVIETEKPITFEETVEHKNHTHTYISIKFPLKDGTGKPYAICNISTDITERKRAEEAIREKDARIRRLVESNIIGIFFWDLEGGITEANDAFFQLIGYSNKDLKEGILNWNKLTPNEYKEADKKAQEELKRIGTSAPYEKEYIRKDGTRIPVLIGGAFLQESKDKGIAFVLNLTDLKKAEDEIRRLNQNLQLRINELTISQNQLQKVNFDLIKTNTDLDNFIYAASHNVKGPASSLEGLINLLDLGIYKAEELPNIISMMKSLMVKFNQTIIDLTELSKVQRLIENKDVVSNNIEEVLIEVIEELNEIIASNKATIIKDFHEAPIVQFSKLNFKRIIYNLISNALKFHAPNRDPQITVRSSYTDEYILLSIEDNGLGIAPYNKDKIFQMFKRAHDNFEGRGIGLYIVKRIIENAGGKIDLESTEGKGSIFYIYFKK